MIKVLIFISCCWSSSNKEIECQNSNKNDNDSNAKKEIHGAENDSLINRNIEKLGVAIKSYNCTFRGQHLLVYEPKSSLLNFYNHKKYTVHWFKNGVKILSDYNILRCVGDGKFTAIVICNRTKDTIGIANCDIPSCKMIKSHILIVVN